MISINKDTANIPNSLISENAKLAFNENIEAEKYIDKKRRYSTNEVKEKLKELYPKCAYCEDSFNNMYPEIEHYRPKKIYYWLAYSWDNLLYSCPKCNRKKSSKFRIEGKIIEFKDENLHDLQNKISNFDKIEKPFIINPEQVTKQDLEKHFSFKFDAKLHPHTEQMKETVDVCDLNRDGLIKLRIKILVELKNNLENLYLTFKNDKNSWFKARQSILDTFEKNITKKSDFSAWRNYIVKTLKSIKTT